MSNSLLTNDVIAKRCLMSLKNSLVFTRNVNREYGKEFAKSGAKIGNTFNIRKPSRYEVTEGATLNIQDSQDQSVPLVLVWQEDDDAPPVQRFRELLCEWKDSGKLWKD